VGAVSENLAGELGVGYSRETHVSTATLRASSSAADHFPRDSSSAIKSSIIIVQG